MGVSFPGLKIAWFHCSDSSSLTGMLIELGTSRTDPKLMWILNMLCC